MANEDQIRLQHMLDAARKTILFTQNRSKDDLNTDDMLTLSVIKLLEIVGEAAKNVSQSLKSSHPDIAWKQIAATRDRLVHGYFDVDYDIVWEIITKDLPTLISALEKIIPKTVTEENNPEQNP
jgi:uncharacterized protein with HEPN domain